MIKIALCDNTKDYREKIKRLILENNYINIKMAFYEYSTEEELLKSLWHMHDLVFLNIEFSNENKVAQKFREKNEKAVLIFCTRYKKPTIESFKLRVYRYILKNLDNCLLKDEIKDILEETLNNFNESYLSITRDGSLFRIMTKAILYISIIKRGSIIHRYSYKGIEDIHCRESLKDIYLRLKSKGFEYAHNSYLVNMENIVHINKSTIILKDNTQLNISRSKKREFDEAFSKFINIEYKRA